MTWKAINDTKRHQKSNTMTTITIDRALLEQALVALSAPNHCVFSEPPICVDIRAALASPATAPDLSAAYIGAREDLAIWKKRALEAEETARQLNRALAEEVNGPTFMGEPVLPATAPEQQKPGECWPTHIMKQWDEMRDLISKGDKSSLPRDWFESLAEMRLIDAPTTAWHDAPTEIGRWLCARPHGAMFTCIISNVEKSEKIGGVRWFGPIPEDTK